jgi:hypothetical protein
VIHPFIIVLATGPDGSKAHPFHYVLEGSSFLFTYLVPAALGLIVAGGAAFIGYKLTLRRDSTAARAAVLSAARAAAVLQNEKVSQSQVALAMARRRAHALAHLPPNRSLPDLDPFDPEAAALSAGNASWSTDAVLNLLDNLAELAEAVAIYRATPSREVLASVSKCASTTVDVLRESEVRLKEQYQRGVDTLNEIDLELLGAFRRSG